MEGGNEPLSLNLTLFLTLSFFFSLSFSFFLSLFLFLSFFLSLSLSLSFFLSLFSFFSLSPLLLSIHTNTLPRLCSCFITMQAVGPFVTEERKDRIARVIARRTLGIEVVLDGLYDVGNVAASARSAEAYGVRLRVLKIEGIRGRWREREKVKGRI